MNRQLTRGLLLVLAVGLISGIGLAATFQTGDVFASVSNGQVNWYRSNGTFVQTLNTGLGGFTTGSAADSAGNLYVTDFSAAAVSKFDNTGTLIGTFGTGYNASPESILFDSAGNAYVGQADGSHQVLKFNSAGTPLASYSPAIENRGTDWIDLAADQHTLFYTSEGNTIKRFDLATNTQLANFASGLPGLDAFALRLLSSGGLLVADSDAVRRLDASGNVVQTYTPTGGSGQLFALNLDPNGTSFWTGDDTTGILYKVNIATGVTEQIINTGAGGSALFGVSVFGEITQASAVPEPGQVGMCIALIGLLAIWRRRRTTDGSQPGM